MDITAKAPATTEVPEASVPKIKRVTWWRRINWSQQGAAYLFLLPALVIFAFFAWFPIVRTVIFSFQKVSLVGDSTWVGFDNFRRMLIDPDFIIAWTNSIVFALISLGIGFFVPIFVSIMVNEMRHAKGFFRLVYFLPTVIPVTVSLIIWRQIYDPDNGVLNAVLALVGIAPQSWLQNPQLVKTAIIFLATWAGFGSSMLIYLAALADIPVEYYEAAEIAGANPFQRILYITLPLLVPTMIIMLILQIIFVVQLFTEPFLLTSGGPGKVTMTPVLEIYRKAFNDSDFGLASAWSMSLIVVLGIFSAVYLRITRNTRN